MNKYALKYEKCFVESVVKECMEKDFFDICPINKVRENLRMPYNEGAAVQFLRTFHCVSFKNICKEIKNDMPKLIREAIGFPEEPIDLKPRRLKWPFSGKE